MEQAVLSPFAAWESFYVIVGSSGAALTGLQFVVIALIADSGREATPREIGAFGTPTVVHFSVVLLISAILSAPWHGLVGVCLALGICGAAGIGYSFVVAGRAKRQTGYKPVFEDWLWHTWLPAIAYAVLLIAAVLLRRWPAPSLFAIGGSAILLLFVGIHNAWDAVTYIAIERPPRSKEGRGSS